MSDRPAEEPLITFFSTPPRTPNYPGRTRLFCDQRLIGALTAELRTRCEWPGAGGGLLLAAAVGAAVIESSRDGLVLVALPASAAPEPLVQAAAQLAVRMGARNLTLMVVGGDDRAIAPFTVVGWHTQGEGPLVRSCSAPPNASLPPSTEMRREWPPVQMSTLLPGMLPPWPIDTTSLPPAAMGDWLAWLASREERMVVANLAAGWREQAPGPALVCALAQVAGDGRRVCWRAPSGTDLRPWLDALQQVGRRGLGLKLLVNANDLPPRPNLAALVGWWVLVPADTAEAAAMFTFALTCEEPVLFGLTPSIPVALPPWPERQPWHPGRGRWLAHGDAATLVCDQRTLVVTGAAALALAAAGLRVGVLLCTCVLPVPVGDLDHAGAGPLIACGSDLGIALASAMTDRDVHVEIVTDVSAPDALVSAVRKLIGR